MTTVRAGNYDFGRVRVLKANKKYSITMTK